MARKNSKGFAQTPDQQEIWNALAHLAELAFGFEATRASDPDLDLKSRKLLSRVSELVSAFMRSADHGRLPLMRHARKADFEILYPVYSRVMKEKLRKEQCLRLLEMAFRRNYRQRGRLDGLNKFLDAYAKSWNELRKSGLSPGNASDPGKELGAYEAACELIGVRYGVSAAAIRKDLKVKTFNVEPFDGASIFTNEDWVVVAVERMFGGQYHAIRSARRRGG